MKRIALIHTVKSVAVSFEEMVRKGVGWEVKVLHRSRNASCALLKGFNKYSSTFFCQWSPAILLLIIP